ncbi:MAG: hypothetical protein NC254_04415 [bacterium]|nr:hypothetical protein [bacterium]
MKNEKLARREVLSLKCFHVCRSVIKRAIVCMCIISEWLDNGEFNNIDRIIVEGCTLDATVVGLLMKNKGKQVYRCGNFGKSYRYEKRTKWIVFDKIPVNVEKGYDILLIPLEAVEK